MTDDKEKPVFNLKSLDELKHKNSLYKAQVYCFNCGFAGTVEKPKGQRIKGARCPNCECKLGQED